MTKSDLQSDLLADLKVAANARPLPTDMAPPTPPPLPIPQRELGPPTPSFDVRLTPLRWNRPRIVSPDPTLGLGLGLRIGPLQVSVTIGS